MNKENCSLKLVDEIILLIRLFLRKMFIYIAVSVK